VDIRRTDADRTEVGAEGAAATVSLAIACMISPTTDTWCVSDLTVVYRSRGMTPPTVATGAILAQWLIRTLYLARSCLTYSLSIRISVTDIEHVASTATPLYSVSEFW